MNYTEHKPTAQQNNGRSSSFTEKTVKTHKYCTVHRACFYVSIQIVCNTFFVLTSVHQIALELREKTR